MPHPIPPRTDYRLLALDVDGTLLGHDGTLSPATARAIARAAEAGLRPVLCTGRRYRRALPVAHLLGLDAPLVCNSGAIVKDPADGRTLWRADLDPPTLAGVLALLDDRGEPAVSMLDGPPDGPDFAVAAYPTGRPLFDDYVAANRDHAAIDPDWSRRPDGPHFHLFAVGDRPVMFDLEAALLDRLPGRVRTFVQRVPRYRGTMCEILHAEAGKWSAVLHLAERWGIRPDQIVAVGDDANDLPMIQGAGLGVAMGHAPETIRAAADRVTAPHDQDGLARFLDELLPA